MLFLNGPEQGLAGKIDVFQQICVFLLAIAAKRGISIARLYFIFLLFCLYIYPPD